MNEIEQQETQESKEAKESRKKTRLEQDLENLNCSVKDLMERPENAEFKDLIQRVMKKIGRKQFLEDNEIQKELNILREQTNFSIEDDFPDLNYYRDALNRIQNAKDRVSALYERALAEHNLIDSVYDALFKTWTGKYSKLSSDKRREGEAEQVLSWMLFTRIDRKNNMSILKTFHEHLTSKSDVISRKITIFLENNRILGSSTNFNPEFRDVMKSFHEKEKESRGTIGWGDVKS